LIQTYGPSNTEPEKARSNTAFHPAVHSSTVYQISSPSPQSRNERSWSWSSLLFSRAQLVSTSLPKERLVSPILLRFFRLWHSTFAAGPLSACRAATNQATTPRLTRSPAFPHATADRGLFPHQTPIPSYQAVTTTLAVAATTTATAAKHCQLISGALLQAPEKETWGSVEDGPISRRYESPHWRCKSTSKPAVSPHPSPGSTHPSSPTCCSCHSRPRRP
jgi:hypothetical protein